MDLLTKDLLINFLLIILPLLLWQILFYKKFMYRYMYFPEWIIFISSISSIFLCIAFPFKHGEFILDLSAIPLILGILYGGRKQIIILTSWALIIRYVTDDRGIVISLILLFLLSIILYFLQKLYFDWLLKQKILVNSALISFLIIVAIVVSKQMYGPIMGLDISIKYISINILCMIFTTILLEVIKMNFEMVQKVIKAEKLEVVSHLAASISHEVRNPLTTSKGFVQLSTDEDLPFQKRKEYLDFALEEMDSAVEVINEYLTFAKPAIDYKENMNVSDEIQTAINIVSPLAKMNNVEIIYQKGGNDCFFIKGERKKFTQCIVNILRNGIESMPSGGNLSVYLQSEYPLIIINIEDEGIGMTTEQINRLGEPYFSTKETGTGLGMMVSFKIVNEMGGNIKVKSSLTKGTCFTINFQTLL